ncbi:uncharacterized protein LOC117125564, partial [Anneissia japonica]|uniref:uncharacterized protein LOC117125564 n=1 Tax=Anneissia japonica TaxID=1529436 RepID=UPI00142571E6
ADVRAQLELRLLTPKAAAAFVKENLAGYARKEINGRGKEVGEDAEKILAVLLRVFGDGNTLPQLQQRFFSYKQMPQQDLLSCSLELVSLYDNIVSLDGAYSACRESSLKSRLAEAVVDENLKRELRRLNIESPKLAFFELRDRAVNWLGTTTDRYTREATVKTVSAETNVLELLKKQTAQIEAQQTQINKLQDQLINGRGQMPVRRYQPSNGRQDRRCYVCDQPGHFKCDCPQRVRRSSNANKFNPLNERSPSS